MHRSGDTLYLPNRKYSLISIQSKRNVLQSQTKESCDWATVSPNLVKRHQNNLRFLYLNHELNQERQISGRLNFDKCSISLLEGLHNPGVIPQVCPTKCTESWSFRQGSSCSTDPVLAGVLTRLNSNRTPRYVQDPPEFLR